MNGNDLSLNGTFVEAALERLIPGYRGYNEAAAISESDLQIRQYFAGIIDGYIKKIELKKREIITKPGGLMLLPQIEPGVESLKAISAKLNYSPFSSVKFGYIKDSENEAGAKLKAFDESLYQILKKLDPLITDFMEASDGQAFSDAQAAVKTWCFDFLNQLDARNHIVF